MIIVTSTLNLAFAENTTTSAGRDNLGDSDGITSINEDSTILLMPASDYGIKKLT